MKPYSMDLRRKVMEAVDGGGTTEEIGERFGIDGSCVRKWRLRLQRRGTLEPDKPPGRKRQFGAKQDAQLKEAVQVRPDATRSELAEAVAEKLGRVFSKPVITRALQRLGFTRKKRRSRPAKGSALTSKRRAKAGRSTRS
jgi:transposase